MSVSLFLANDSGVIHEISMVNDEHVDSEGSTESEDSGGGHVPPGEGVVGTGTAGDAPVTVEILQQQLADTRAEHVTIVEAKDQELADLSAQHAIVVNQLR